MPKSMLERLIALERKVKELCYGLRNNTGVPNLQQVTDEGHTTTNDIELLNAAKLRLGQNGEVVLNNTSLLREGIYDIGFTGNLIVEGINIINSGEIDNSFSGWGQNPSMVLWSDLNGVYVKTSVAVTPSDYGNSTGMQTFDSDTFNYYLQHPTNPGYNGIAYFLAPGNQSGFINSFDQSQYLDPPANFWRFCVGSDWPYTYFTNPSTDPYNFPVEGWVPVGVDLPNELGGLAYNYINNYVGGFNVKYSFDDSITGGISQICSVGYENNWQGGISYIRDLNGKIRSASNCLDIVPNYSFDATKQFKIGSRWTLDNGDTYLCTRATSNDAVWELISIKNKIIELPLNDLNLQTFDEVTDVVLEDFIKTQNYVQKQNETLYFVIKEVDNLFDVTADNWKSDVSDEQGFTTLLENMNMSNIQISNYSFNGSRVRCNLNCEGTELDLKSSGVTQVNSIGRISGLLYLRLLSNSLTKFDPLIPLPNTLLGIRLSENNLAEFNPTLPLPESLTDLDLSKNNLTRFSLTLPLPITLIELDLNSNLLNNLSYTLMEPWANAQPSFLSNCNINFSYNIDSISGTQLQTILTSKNAYSY